MFRGKTMDGAGLPKVESDDSPRSLFFEREEKGTRKDDGCQKLLADRDQINGWIGGEQHVIAGF